MPEGSIEFGQGALNGVGDFKRIARSLPSPDGFSDLFIDINDTNLLAHGGSLLRKAGIGERSGELLDLTNVIVPVLAADEGGGVDGEGVVDVDASADAAVFLGPPDAFFEIGVGKDFVFAGLG